MTTQPLLIGAHTSAQGGVHKAILEGESIGATTIQLFTANQKRWKGKPISDEEVKRFKEAKDAVGLDKIMSHDSYLINLGSPDPDILAKSQTAFEEELYRCQQLELSYLNFHPGASTKGTKEACLDQIISSLLATEKQCARGHTRLLLETTAGQGTTIGADFSELGYIIENTKGKIPIGVCIDTCHIFAAGYDIRTPEAWNETLNEFDEKIGLEHLYALHVNDSLKPFASRRDRHAALGKGDIGIEAFRFMMQDERLKYLPKYLETPDGKECWKEEIAQLKRFANE